jgi:predicted transcriptional regulator
MTNKQLVMQALEELPDEASMDDILDRIETLAAIREGLADVEAGRLISIEELKRLSATWLSK